MAFPKIYQKLLERLPLSGGTMTGDLQFAGGNIRFNKRTFGICGRTNDTYLEICPGPTSAFASKTGASLMMSGRDYTGNSIPKGYFFLTAASEANGNKSLVGSPDGTLTWCGEPVLYGESGGFPVGFITLYGGSNVPDGWFRCDGSTVTNMQTNYPKLYAVLGTNVLPNYSGKYPLGSSTKINSAVAAGLPNILGDFAPREAVGYLKDGVHNGAFSNFVSRPIGKNGVGFLSGETGYILHFDASLSNATYGASDTVTPPSVKCAYLIRHD